MTGVAVADGDPAVADRVAGEIVELYWRKRREFLVPTERPAEAIRKGRELAGGPVIWPTPPIASAAVRREIPPWFSAPCSTMPRT